MSQMTVTATQGGAIANGIYMQIRVLLGANAASLQNGAAVGAQSTTPNLSITPNASGSLLFCSMLSLNTATTAEAAETALSTRAVGSLYFSFFQSSSTTSVGTPVLMGSSTSTGIAISSVEILGNGSGFTIWNSQPQLASNANATSASTPSFSPPPGALLVAMVSSNGSVGTTTMTITDSLGLTWTCLQQENGSGHGYVGVWVAQLSDPLPTLSFVSDVTVRGNTTSAQTMAYVPASAKSLIVCCASLYSGDASVRAITSISDNAGNTWHYAITDGQSPPSAGHIVSGQYYTCFIGWTWQDKGVATSYSVNFNGSAFVNMNISEWSDVGSITGCTASAGSTSSADFVGPTTSVTVNSVVLEITNTVNGLLAATQAMASDGVAAGWMTDESNVNFVIYSGNGPADPLQLSDSPYNFSIAGFGSGNDYATALIVLNSRGAPTGSMFKVASQPGLS